MDHTTCRSVTERDFNAGRGLETTSISQIMPLPKVKYAARRLFSALRAIHSASIAHRDIDVNNICISNPEGPGLPMLTIVDLGDARSEGDDLAELLGYDIIRLAMIILELGMKPQPANTARLSFEKTNNHILGSLDFNTSLGLERQ